MFWQYLGELIFVLLQSDNGIGRHCRFFVRTLGEKKIYPFTTILEDLHFNSNYITVYHPYSIIYYAFKHKFEPPKILSLLHIKLPDKAPITNLLKLKLRHVEWITEYPCNLDIQYWNNWTILFSAEWYFFLTIHHGRYIQVHVSLKRKKECCYLYNSLQCLSILHSYQPVPN